MAKLSKNSVKLSPTVKLVKRERTSLWQAHITTDSGLRRVSTNEEDLDKAKSKALELEAEHNVLVKHGMPTSTDKTYTQVASKYIDVVESGDANISASSSVDYKRVINKYLIPFFGSKHIVKIDDDAIAEYEKWRKKELTHEPSKSMVNMHNVVIRAVFDFAVQKKWMQRNDVPKLTTKGKGKKSEPYGYFTKAEFGDFLKFIDQWRKEGSNSTTRYKRHVLLYYVHLLASIGSRPGEETLHLKWQDCQKFKAEDGNFYYDYQLTKGKHAQYYPRKPLSELVVFDFLEALKSITKHNKPTDYVFCMPDGKMITHMPQLMNQCVTEAGMKYDNDGKKRVLYSCRHSFATWQLEDGSRTYEQLASQMGTSPEMLRKHYSHVKLRRIASQVALPHSSTNEDTDAIQRDEFTNMIIEANPELYGHMVKKKD